MFRRTLGATPRTISSAEAREPMSAPNTTKNLLRVSIAVAAMKCVTLAYAQDRAPLSVRLMTPLEFADKSVSGWLPLDAVERLLDERVLAPRYPYAEGLRLTGRSVAETTFVTTCREYNRLIEARWYAENNFDIHAESSFIRNCGSLLQIAQAHPIRKSYISACQVGLTNIELLPALLLPAVLDSDGEELQRLASRGETYATMVRHGDASVTLFANRNSLRSTYHEMRQDLFEIARGDFNGDGVEDILAFGYDTPEGPGTYFVSYLLLLTRTNATSHFDAFRYGYDQNGSLGWVPLANDQTKP